MKKIYLFSIFACFSLIGNAQINWQRSQAFGNTSPAFVGVGNNTRGMAALGDKMYVLSREGGTKIKVINGLTGADLADVSDYTGVAGGTWTLADVEVSTNGAILACNMTTNASTSTFKIYKWDNETATPSLYASYSDQAIRLGDVFTVVGDISANAVITAAGNGKVVRWIVTGGVLGAPTTITLADTHGSAMIAYPQTVSASPSLFVKSNGQPLRKYNADGTSAGESILTTIVGSGANDFKYFTLGTEEYIAIFQYGAGTNGECATLVKVTGGLANAVTIKATPKLGSNANANGTGGVGIKTELDLVDGINNTITVYALGTNNGISGTTLVYQGATLAKKEFSISEAKIFPNPAENEFQINLNNSVDKNAEAVIYNANGQQVKSSRLTSELQTISISDLSRGIYLVKIKNGGNQSTTKLIKN